MIYYYIHLYSFFSFYDSESPQAFFAKQKVDIPKNNANDFSIKQGLCPICYMDVNPLVELSCKHMFCTDCWNSYLLTRFRSEADPYPSCMDLKCHYYLDEDVILKLLQSSEEKKFFSRLLVKSFVDCNPAMKWCPGTDCSKAVKVKAAECRAVTCDCGTTFCFQCSQEWHEPLTCALLNRWVKKYSGDSESMKWVSVNTKDCPKCNAAIEKNGGCNHMVCRLKSCGYEFCWFCMEDWKKHGYSNTGCNRYEESSDVSDKANNFRESLKRYMHYYDRFANHRKSLLAESALMELIALKIEQMQSKSYSWIETQFLRDAVKVLNECRRSLMFAYAFAYYLPDSNTKKIFEHNQNDLEVSLVFYFTKDDVFFQHATEELSGLLERDIDLETEDLVTLKQKASPKML